MSQKAYINPVVLRWSRETAKLSIEAVAGKMAGCNPERIARWEMGEEFPTVTQAEKLSKLYRRPLAVFYLPEPPRDFETLKDFRRKDHRKEYSTALTFMIRDIQAKQAWIKDTFKEIGEEHLTFVGKFTPSSRVEDIALNIRKTLQIEDAPQTHDILKYWTERAEANRIFVCLSGNIHSRLPLAVEEVRGFAISDPMAPFIFINSHDYKNAQLFTLVHELVHLWIDATGVFDLAAVEFRSDQDKEKYDPIEIFCNGVTAEVLMPQARIRERLKHEQSIQVETIEHIARDFSVSSLAMAVRLLNLGMITKNLFSRAKVEFDRKFQEFKAKEAAKEKKGGPDYYLLQTRKNSKAFSHLVYDFFKGGQITGYEAATLLNIKVNQFSKLETFLLS